MDDVARVVLAMEQHDVAEEVMHFLDRSGHTRVVATAADDRQLREAVRQLEPDAVIGQPSLLADAAVTRPFLAVDTRESVGCAAGRHPGRRRRLLRVAGRSRGAVGRGGRDQGGTRARSTGARTSSRCTQLAAGRGPRSWRHTSRARSLGEGRRAS